MHIVVGLIAVLAGIGLFFGAIWARTVAVIIAAVSIVANFLWLPYYPVWAVLIIVFDLFVIWALTPRPRCHDRERSLTGRARTPHVKNPAAVA
jgi:uncharacterized membrane protein